MAVLLFPGPAATARRSPYVTPPLSPAAGEWRVTRIGSNSSKTVTPWGLTGVITISCAGSGTIKCSLSHGSINNELVSVS